MQSINKLFTQEVSRIFAGLGDCVTPNPISFESRLAQHKNLPDTCFHVLDLRTLDIVYTHGIERIFGIPKQVYTYATLSNTIHPSYLILFIAKALAIYRYLDKYPTTVQPDMPYFYNVFLPMKLKRGKYHRVRQMSIPFGIR